MAQPTVSATRNDGSSTVVTVTLPGTALATGQVNQRKASYVNDAGTSIEATVDMTGYTPVAGIE